MITARRRKRLKRRSAANSTEAKRLSSATFYLDESINSNALADAIKSAGAAVVRPPDVGLTAADDPTWAAKIGPRNWLVLMRDKHIRRRRLEREALVAAGLGAFVCTAGEATAAETAKAVLTALRTMVNIGTSEPRPFIYVFGLAGVLRKLPSRELR